MSVEDGILVSRLRGGSFFGRYSFGLSHFWEIPPSKKARKIVSSGFIVIKTLIKLN